MLRIEEGPSGQPYTEITGDNNETINNSETLSSIDNAEKNLVANYWQMQPENPVRYPDGSERPLSELIEKWAERDHDESA